MRLAKTLLLVFLVSMASAIEGPVTVSGLSSGGFMTAQLHIAYSDLVKGAAVFAGGPYYCAEGDLTKAVTTCMAMGGAPIDKLFTQITAYSAGGQIDDYENVNGNKVYIFDGISDRTVNPKVGQDGEKLYARLGADIKTEYTLNDGHGMPTEDYGVSCSSTGSPYINSCHFSGAYDSLAFLYGEGIRQGQSFDKFQIKQIPQKAASGSSMASNAFAYVPKACEDGGCAIHVVFHGCAQTTEDIQMQYVENTGYNEVAEASGLIMLYPQIKKSYFNPSNPNGCWDWFGYTNKDYATKDGVQMKEVYRLITGLQEGTLEMTPLYETKDLLKNISE